MKIHCYTKQLKILTLISLYKAMVEKKVAPVTLLIIKTDNAELAYQRNKEICYRMYVVQQKKDFANILRP